MSSPELRIKALPRTIAAAMGVLLVAGCAGEGEAQDPFGRVTCVVVDIDEWTGMVGWPGVDAMADELGVEPVLMDAGVTGPGWCREEMTPAEVADGVEVVVDGYQCLVTGPRTHPMLWLERVDYSSEPPAASASVQLACPLPESMYLHGTRRP